MITLDGTLPPDTFDVQVEGIPPGDYVYVTTVSLAGLLRLVERLGGPPSQWPLMTDWVDLFARFSVEPQPPCSDEALLDAEASLGLSLPDDLRGLLKHSNGLIDRAGRWYFVWPLERIVADNLVLRAEAEGGFPTDAVRLETMAPALRSALRHQGTSPSVGGRRSTLKCRCSWATWTASLLGG